MKEYYPLIKQLPLFDHFKSDKDLDWIFNCIDGSVKTYSAGETIFSKGEDMYFAAVVLEGMVQEMGEDAAEIMDFGDFLFSGYEEGKSVAAPADYVAKTDCKLLLMRWIRMAKVCNFECEFHKQLLAKYNELKR